MQEYKITKFSPIQYQIINEIGMEIGKLGAKSDLMASVMSWRYYV